MRTEKIKFTEGWVWLSNSKKRHYFSNGRSLCDRWMLLSQPDTETGNNNSPDNCAMCKKRLAKHKPAPVRNGNGEG